MMKELRLRSVKAGMMKKGNRAEGRGDFRLVGGSMMRVERREVGEMPKVYDEKYNERE